MEQPVEPPRTALCCKRDLHRTKAMGPLENRNRVLKRLSVDVHKEIYMNRKAIFSVMVLAATLASTPAVFAAPYGGANTVNTAATGKAVKFALRNDSASPMKLKVGDQVLTLAAGATINVKASIGQTVTAEEASATNPAGAILATVIDGLSGATVVVR